METILIFIMAIILIGMGLFTMAITAIGAIGTYINNWWNDQATQGTIILTGISACLLLGGVYIVPF